jgi:hypothetical protein
MHLGDYRLVDVENWRKVILKALEGPHVVVDASGLAAIYLTMRSLGASVDGPQIVATAKILACALDDD